MAEQATPPSATPPATSGGTALETLSKQDIAALIGQAVSAAVAPLNATISALQKGQDTLAEQLGKAATAETVGKAVAEQIAARQSADAQSKARIEFVATTLKGVPAAYAEKLGGDMAKWADEAKAIREGYRSDLEAAGFKPQAISSDAPAGGAVKTPDALIDTSKLTAIELIDLGVKASSAAVQPGNAAPAVVAPPEVPAANAPVK